MPVATAMRGLELEPVIERAQSDASAAVLDLWVRHGDGSRETLRVSPAAPNEVSPPANEASRNAVSEPAGSSDTGEPDEPDEDGE